MPNSNLDVRLQARISDFVEEINGLVREAAVEAVQEALTEGRSPRSTTPRKKTTKKTRAKRKSGKRVRRTGAQVDALAKKALTAIKGKPGRRLGEIAKELRSTAKDIRRPVQNLLDDEKVKTTGQRGGTRYFPSGGAKKAAKSPRKTAKRKTSKRRTKAGK